MAGKDQIDESISKFLDHQRWLMNNGLFTEASKDNLFVYGAMIHTKVIAVECDIDPVKRVVDYKLYFDSSFIELMNKFESLLTSDSVVSLWRVRRILRKHGNVSRDHFTKVANGFVRDYCGPKWTTNLTFLDIENYQEGYEQTQDSSLEPQKG